MALASRDEPVLKATLLPTTSASAEATSSETIDVRVERHKLVFVDTNTEHYQTLLDGLIGASADAQQFDIHLLDGDANGITRISEVLAGQDDKAAVHIISHGQDGWINLGNARLSSDNLDGNATVIQYWASAFSADGDLLLYGCNLADSASGKAFVTELARLTGADVAASDDLTGHASLEGDWDLEYQVGHINTQIALASDAQAQWVGVLADTTTGLTGHWTFDTNADDASGTVWSDPSIEKLEASTDVSASVE